MATEKQTGNISIHAQNIMPVIKRWLYSDKDIFIRELVSNGCDAITKLKMAGQGEEEDLRVTVTIDRDKGELRFSDNGVGMTWEEVEKYINQVAFSSAEDFLAKYTGEDSSGIIGHFGLGFYSAFMAADKVQIDTLSFEEGAKPVRWESSDGMEFAMTEGDRAERGTTITLHILEDEKEFLEATRVREVLERYCGYLSVPVYLLDLSKPTRAEKRAQRIAEREKRKAERAAEKAKKKAEGKEDDTPDYEDDSEPYIADNEVRDPQKPVNDTHPLWLKAPKDCTEDEYKETYKKLFHTWEDPLFWVHLNVDYPFNLKGILYFPRIKRDFGGQEGEIKLFNRQVFVADNIKEVIPEFLMLLKGVIDCPDLPLNVSRSFLQNDGYVKKLSAHITKKVADRLNGLFNTERETYQTYWDDIHPFVKYGCIRDAKFYESVKDSLLLKTTKGEYYTLAEYKSRNEGKTAKKIYYTTEPSRQAAAVALYADRGIDVAVMDTVIDMNFLSFMEYGAGNKDEIAFTRVDADTEGLTEETDEGKDIQLEPLETLFRKALDKPDLEIKLEALSDAALPLLLLEDEQMRRYKEMSAMYGQSFDMPAKYTLVLNRKSDTVRSLADMDEETATLLARQMYDVARLSSRPLESDDLRSFLQRSNEIIAKLARK